jgi:hypothetical protein
MPRDNNAPPSRCMARITALIGHLITFTATDVQGGLPPKQNSRQSVGAERALFGDTRIEQRSAPFARCQHRMSAVPGSNRRADDALRRKANRRNSILRDPSLGSDSHSSSWLSWPRIVGHLERQPSIWHPQVPGWATVCHWPVRSTGAAPACQCALCRREAQP